MPPAPPGAEWRLADDIEVGDLVAAEITLRVVSVARKPTRVWLTLEPDDPDDAKLRTPFPLAEAPPMNIRPTPDEYIACIPNDEHDDA